jgi:GNAT superfamily N-acetyltransferase
MSRFERCNVKTCVHELMALGNNNPRMWNLFNWLATHDELQYGTQAEIIKLYVEDKLVGYSLLENYQARTDKVVQHKGVTYQDLGVVHFRTLDLYRNKGYATLLAKEMYSEIIAPMLACHTHVHGYITAIGRASPLMVRTDISPLNLLKEFYSDASFEMKVVNYFREQAGQELGS